jgi:tetratricopeptide (TPR) repeat protein
MLRTVLTASLWLVATAALADSKSDCLDSKDHDLRIKACSMLLQRNPKDVIAYYNRGDAYGLKGDLDRAISDYSKAIELNPNYAPAYNGRGRAYTGKGDYTHAVADVTKASELAPKLRPWPAVIRAAPAKAKEVAKLTPAAPGKVPAAEKAAAAPAKAPVGEKPADNAWPAWAQSTLTN